MEDTSITEEVSFSVSGEFITDHFRGRVLEGCWRHALKGLMESLKTEDEDGKAVECSYDVAIRILRGEKKLVGVNDLDYVDEDLEVKVEYQSQVDWLYAGYYYDTIHDLIYTPYAMVTNYGQHDVQVRGISDMLPNDPRWHIERAKHYCDDYQRDFLIIVDNPLKKKLVEFPTSVVALFKRVTIPPPLWIMPLQDPHKALDQYLDDHILQERGHQQIYGRSESIYTKNKRGDHSAGTVHTCGMTWSEGEYKEDI
ncbi:MAG: hypothetical protein GY861_06740, partial [bacterium]|nr:hypothetical protein [bacterium]